MNKLVVFNEIWFFYLALTVESSWLFGERDDDDDSKCPFFV